MKTYKVTVDSFGTQHWYNSKDQLHREDAPAVIWNDGDKEYWLNGQRHREDAPAVIWNNGDQYYYLNGQLHREDGPAIIQSNGTEEYFLNGQRLSETEFIARTQKPSCEGQIIVVHGVEYTLQRKS